VRSSWKSVVDDLALRCAPAGLDLVQPFRLAWYNCVVSDAFKLPDLGRKAALGVLIGNTRALWPCFLDALRVNPPALDDDHPLDSYVAAAVLRALQPLSYRWEVRLAPEPPPRRVAMQRLAHVSGLAYLSPSRLNVHATYGPWIALRAAVVIDIDGPATPPPVPPNPCPDCESDCMPKFRHALAAAGGTPQDRAAIEPHWQLWLAVRDACPVGRVHRYGDDQIRYHYTKDREGLKRLLGNADR
jgi:methylmalonic aciduria homocystinuria type C protein